MDPNMVGDDDVKHQDDVGEVSSPGSQDHHSNEQEEIEAGENTGKIEVVDEPNKEAEDESVVVIEREIKNESSRKSYDGGSSDSSSSSSSSSSDDESHAIKSSEAVVDSSPVLDSVQVIDEVIYSAATEEAHDSVEEIIADVEALKEEVEVSTDSPANSYAPPHIVESVFKEEIEEKVSCAVEAEVGIVEDSKDAVLTSVENIIAISETKECVAQETDDRLSLACDAPIATADNGVDIEEISGVTEPLLAPAPHPVEKTSWKCCCGLFDVFTGSGR